MIIFFGKTDCIKYYVQSLDGFYDGSCLRLFVRFSPIVPPFNRALSNSYYFLSKIGEQAYIAPLAVLLLLLFFSLRSHQPAKML